MAYGIYISTDGPQGTASGNTDVPRGHKKEIQNEYPTHLDIYYQRKSKKKKKTPT